jgi:hypothetical protein
VSVAQEFTEDLGLVDSVLQQLGEHPESAVAEPDRRGSSSAPAAAS